MTGVQTCALPICRRNYETIRAIIVDPLSNYDESEMPPFGDKLPKEQIDAMARYLASRK